MSSVAFYLAVVFLGALPCLVFYVWLPEVEEVDQ